MAQPLEQRQEPTGVNIRMNDEPMALVQISPPRFQFGASRVSAGQVSKIKLKNKSSAPVGYKFKTNAPMKYSVKPVLGALGPGESVKIFVRTQGWISPQDKFLLQSVSLTEDEQQVLDATVWKTLDPKRFVEYYIPCTSPSALSLRDLEEDVGSLSSSSAASSVASSPSFHAYDTVRSGQHPHSPHQPYQQYPQHPQGAPRQVYERWQLESTRPTISIGGLGRRFSGGSTTTSSSTSPTSPGALYTPRPLDASPTLTPTTSASTSPFASKRGSIVSSNIQNPSSIIKVKEEHVKAGYQDTTNVERLSYGLESRLKALQFSKSQLLVLSLLCLMLGLLAPLDRLLLGINGGGSKTFEAQLGLHTSVNADAANIVATTTVASVVDQDELVDSGLDQAIVFYTAADT
ncbi:phosphatidylinositol-binding protein scs2 [Mortierella sp. GBA43]|nr:phosphatidylinositol-binding protein scs2 [Mortierella sp. GBA43]